MENQFQPSENESTFLNKDAFDQMFTTINEATTDAAPEPASTPAPAPVPVSTVRPGNQPSRPVVNGSDNKAMVQKTEKNLDLMGRNAEQIDSKTQELLSRNRTVLQKLFPSKMDQMMKRMEANTIEDAMQFRQNLYALSTEFRLEALRERYNAGLMMIRADHRQKVAEFVISRLYELHKVVNAKQRAFFELAKEKYDYAALQGNYPTLQQKYEYQIEIEFDNFFVFLARQLTSFESIMDEQIKKFE